MPSRLKISSRRSAGMGGSAWVCRRGQGRGAAVQHAWVRQQAAGAPGQQRQDDSGALGSHLQRSGQDAKQRDAYLCECGKEQPQE